MEQNCEWLFYYFDFQRNFDILKLKSSYILLKKDINFNKNKTELKIENPTQFQRDKPCASAPTRMQIKRKTVISWSL